MADEKHEKEISIDFIEEEDSEKPADEGTEEKEKYSTEAAHEGKEHGKSAKKSRHGDKKVIEEYKKQYEELNEQFLRLRAEFANYKRRMEREQIEFSDYVKREIVKKLLPILDDFDHMFKNPENEAGNKSLWEGAKMIHDKLSLILSDFGVQKIEALESEFDPQLHEAIMMQNTDRKDHNGKVISVFQEGYLLNDRLIRPSKVVVGQYFNPEEKN
jgi:molecular chaperone GrpE